MKKIAILGMICMFFVAGTTSLYAQRGQRQGRNAQKSILSANQKEQMKEVRIKYASETKDLYNQLNELQAHQQTLVSANKPNKSEVYANIDKMSAIKKELNLKRLDMRIDMRSSLNEEQLMCVGNRSGRYAMKRGQKQAQRGKQGMRQGREQGMRQGRRQGNFQDNEGKQFAQRGQRENRGQMQRGRKGQMHRGNMLNLSDEQKTQMKELRFANVKDTKILRDEAEVLRLKQRQMMTSENPDKGILISNVNSLSKIITQLAKKRFDNRLEMRKILDEDQLVLFLSHSGNRKGFKHQRRAF